MRQILPLFLTLIFASNGWGADCSKAIELYNQATVAKDLQVKERGFKKAIPLCSDPIVLSKVYNNLADTYERQDRLLLALAYYRKALETKPDFATAYFSVGDIFFRLRDYFSAAVMYGKGLKYRSEDEESIQRKEQAETMAKGYMVIYFDFDSFRIPDRYLKRLDAVGKDIKERGIDGLLAIKVIGHTCDLGPRAYNRHLSLKRAKEVAKYVTEKFFVPTRTIQVIGKGEDAPMFVGSERNARILNRRVEITLSFRED